MEKSIFKISCVVLSIIGLFCLVMFLNLYLKDVIPAEEDWTSSELLKFRFEIIKVILVSVVVGLLGMFVPSLLAEKKYNFEQKIEGRRLYSIVKTGLNYLPERLANMKYGEAMEHLQSIHQAYHLVVLYPDSEDKCIGNYRNYFKCYHIHKLRKPLSKLMCKTEYIESSTLDRIQLIKELRHKISNAN